MKTCTLSIRHLCLLMLILAGSSPVFSQQIQKHITISTGESIGFLEFKPRDYAKTSNTYPVIIFLHGIGERGNGTTDLSKVACCGIPRIISWGHNMTFTWNGKKETFLVLSPQCPSKYGMWPEVLVDDLIKYAKDSLRADPDRVFLTGLSMGAGGTYKYISGAQKWADNIAAAAAIAPPCVFNNATYLVNNNMPFWGWHAADDAVVSYTCTEAAVAKINALNPKVKPLKTIWPTGGHNVWDRVYTDTSYVYDGAVNVYEWFLGQGRRGGPINVLPVAKTANSIGTTTTVGVATLDASASTDADGHIVRYVWKKISGPSAGYITTAFGTSPSTTVAGLTIAGTYQYQLTVVDDRASFARDTLTVNVATGAAAVPNKLPFARTSGNTSITLPTNSVTLNGSASYDEDGSIASYAWSKVSGGTATISAPSAAITTVTNLSEGTYAFKLIVTDDKGAKEETQLSVTVNPAPNKAPVAKTSGSASITLPTNSVTLNGSTSSDEDGTIASYAWSKVSGGNATITAPSAVSTTVTNLAEGVYTFKLIVTDNKGDKGEAQLTVTVNPAPNKAPVAKTSGNTAITLPTNSVTLNGSTSSDEDGTIASYAWSKVSGGNATITAPSAASTTVTNLAEGVYTFKLIVTDNKGDKGETQLTVTVNPAPVVPNKAPVAKTSGNTSITLPTNSVTLNGSTSSDEDGTIASYAWSKVSGGNATITASSAVSTTVTNLAEGVYTFKLIVTDNKGDKGETQLTVTVNPAPVVLNKLPVANAGVDLNLNLGETNQATLNGAVSYDPDGFIKEVLWKKINGPAAGTIENPTAVTTTAINLAAGVYTFEVTVTDNSNASSTDQMVVTVDAPVATKPIENLRPIADAGTDVAITTDFSRVLVKGQNSRDTDGWLSRFYWRKVSGPSGDVIETENTANTYISGLQQGSYVYRFTVIDNLGDSASDDVNVTVNGINNQAPIADAGTDTSITTAYPNVLLNAIKSKDNDGYLTSIRWNKLSGPSACTIEKCNTVTTHANGLEEGTYIFRVTVKDNRGDSTYDDVKIVVNRWGTIKGNEAPIANAGLDQVTTVDRPKVLIKGYLSKDNDGWISSFIWARVSGPDGSVIEDTKSANTYISGLVQGVYVYRFTVTDNKGASSYDDVLITVNPSNNISPVANAGTDKDVTVAYPTVLLTGYTSKDPDGYLVSVNWTKVSGPDGDLMSTPNSVNTYVSGLKEGEYVYRATVTDNHGDTDSDDVVVRVTNPYAVASLSKVEPAINEGISAYPNPASSSIMINYSSAAMGKSLVTFYDAYGKPARSVSFDKTQIVQQIPVNITDLAHGMYHVIVTTGQTTRMQLTILKQ